MRGVAFTTELDALVGAFVRAGHEATVAPWDDRSIGWARADAVVVKATWDYHERLDQFLEWAEMVDAVTSLVNDAEVVRWSADKRYLLELETAGVPIVPTALVESDFSPRPSWSEVVVKPAVGASGFLTSRRLEDLPRVLAHGPALIQPYVDSVTTIGEVSVVAIAGEPMAAFRKLPATGEFRVQPEYGGATAPTTLTDQLAGLAVAALAAAPGEPVLARVDVVDVDGQWVVMELELVEPHLWAEDDVRVRDRLVSAVTARARGQRSR